MCVHLLEPKKRKTQYFHRVKHVSKFGDNNLLKCQNTREQRCEIATLIRLDFADSSEPDTLASFSLLRVYIRTRSRASRLPTGSKRVNFKTKKRKKITLEVGIRFILFRPC